MAARTHAPRVVKGTRPPATRRRDRGEGRRAYGREVISFPLRRPTAPDPRRKRGR